MREITRSRMTRLFLCGDVMTGRGVDQILAHPGGPGLQEPYVRDARDYVELADGVNGPIRRPVRRDGSNLRQLTDLKSDVYEAVWARDGRALASAKGRASGEQPEMIVPLRPASTQGQHLDITI